MTEQEFEAQILKALEDIDAARQGQPRQDPLAGVLERFARTLSRHPALGAAVQPATGQREGLQLVIWPKLRRDDRALLLSFVREGKALRLLDQEQRQFVTEGGLEAYLTQELLRSPSFAEILADYEERCNAPVTGFLRRGGPLEVVKDDVLVHVLPDEQRKLAEAPAGGDVTILVRDDRVPIGVHLPRDEHLLLNSLYESGGTYTCLTAGGYGMWAMFHSRAEDGRLRIAGPAMSEDELLVEHILSR
jgi:hypothetical protein